MSDRADAWKRDYLNRQAKINDWAREFYRPRIQRRETIVIRHPADPNPSPCHGCGAEFFCGKPCEAKRLWEKGEAVWG